MHGCKGDDQLTLCDHWKDCGVEDGGCCSAGHYGGKPSLGVCKQCVYLTVDGKKMQVRDVVMPVANSEPISHGPMHYIAGAAKAVVASVTADSPMSERRLAICKGCDQWTGSRCKQCGCFTGLKVRLPAERCPMGKWEAEG